MPTITLDDLERQFGEIAVRTTNLQPVMQAGGVMYLSEVKDRFNQSVGPDGTPWLPLKMPRPQGGSLPLRSTGMLLASFSSFYTPSSFGVGTNHPGARVHQYGATIRPVKAKKLTIPLTKEAVYAGRATNMSGLFILRSGRSLFLARREGKANRVRRHWLLVDRVKVLARPMVGISQPLLNRTIRLLVGYFRTGKLQYA